jgi:hypothetical protein
VEEPLRLLRCSRAKARCGHDPTIGRGEVEARGTGFPGLRASLLSERLTPRRGPRQSAVVGVSEEIDNTRSERLLFDEPFIDQGARK